MQKDFHEKNASTPFTFTPRVEENVRVRLGVPAGAKDSVGGPHGDIHAELPHNALGGGLDGQPDELVLLHDDLGPPLASLQFRDDGDRDVSSLVLLRVATCEEKGHRVEQTSRPVLPSRRPFPAQAGKQFVRRDAIRLRLNVIPATR